MQVASNPGPAQGFPKGRDRIAPVGRTPQPAQLGRGEMAILKKQADRTSRRPENCHNRIRPDGDAAAPEQHAVVRSGAAGPHRVPHPAPHAVHHTIGLFAATGPVGPDRHGRGGHEATLGQHRHCEPRNACQAVACSGPAAHCGLRFGGARALDHAEVLKHLVSGELWPGNCPHGRREPGVAAADAGLVEVDHEPHRLHAGGGAASLSGQANCRLAAQHESRAIIHPAADRRLRGKVPEDSPLACQDRHKQGCEGATCRQSGLRQPCWPDGVADLHSTLGTVHREARPQDQLGHPRLPEGRLQKVELQAVVGFDEVDRRGPGPLARGTAEAERGRQDGRLELRLLAAADKQICDRLEANLQLLRTGLAPGPVHQRQHRYGPGLQPGYRLAAFRQQRDVG